MSQRTLWPQVIAQMSRALQAYERVETHLRVCQDCAVDEMCGTAEAMYLAAHRLRKEASPERRWSNAELGLDELGFPTAPLEPVANE